MKKLIFIVAVLSAVMAYAGFGNNNTNTNVKESNFAVHRGPLDTVLAVLTGLDSGANRNFQIIQIIKATSLYQGSHVFHLDSGLVLGGRFIFSGQALGHLIVDSFGVVRSDTTSLSGPTGATGITGPTGQNGTNGATGATGTNGITGASGNNGVTGPTGADGALNAWGLNGSSGTTFGSNFIGTTDNTSFSLNTSAGSPTLIIANANDLGAYGVQVADNNGNAIMQAINPGNGPLFGGGDVGSNYNGNAFSVSDAENRVLFQTDSITTFKGTSGDPIAQFNKNSNNIFFNAKTKIGSTSAAQAALDVEGGILSNGVDSFNIVNGIERVDVTNRFWGSTSGTYTTGFKVVHYPNINTQMHTLNDYANDWFTVFKISSDTGDEQGATSWNLLSHDTIGEIAWFHGSVSQHSVAAETSDSYDMSAFFIDGYTFHAGAFTTNGADAEIILDSSKFIISAPLQINDGTQATGYVLSSDNSGNASWKRPTIGDSFSQSETAVSTITVTIPTQDNTTYKVVVTASNSLSSVAGYVTNKTTTSFDWISPTPLTGTVAFDWILTP